MNRINAHHGFVFEACMIILLGIFSVLHVKAENNTVTMQLISSATEVQLNSASGAYSEYANETSSDVIRSYVYYDNGLLKSYQYQQVGWNTYQDKYTYDEDGELIQEYDGDTSKTYTFTYDSEGRPVKEVRSKNGVTNQTISPVWSGENCMSYAGTEYTFNSSGQILSEKSSASYYINKEVVSDIEVNTFSYDGNGNVCKTVWSFPGSDSRTYTFSMTYKNGIVISATDSTHNYGYQITYMQTNVPVKYVKIVRAQQKSLLHSLNSSAPYIMRRLQFASVGNLVKDETKTDTASSGDTSASSGEASSGSKNISSGTAAVSSDSAVTGTATTVSNGVYKLSGSAAVLTSPRNKDITSLTIPATVKIGGKARKVTKINANAFKGCSKLKTVTIGKNVTSIGANAFSGCKALAKVSIGAGVKTIGKNAFLNCVKLKTVSGGKGLTTIGASAFSGCKALTKITLYGKVKKIGAKAFYKCSKLKTITVKTSKLTSKTVGANAFKGIYAKAAIKVPKAKLKAYTTLLKKKGVGKNVKITK